MPLNSDTRIEFPVLLHVFCDLEFESNLKYQKANKVPHTLCFRVLKDGRAHVYPLCILIYHKEGFEALCPPTSSWQQRPVQ